MTEKLKYKPKTGLYRLHLNVYEAELIAALVRSIRLSMDDDAYREAACTLCEAFSDKEEFDCDVLDDIVSVGSSLDAEGDTTIEVSEKSQAGCRGSCKGCSCSD